MKDCANACPICGGDKKKITDYADWTEKTIREIRKIRNR